MTETTTEARIIAVRDFDGHWSAHLAGQPEYAFGGNTPRCAELRVMEVNMDIGQHLAETCKRAERVEFELR